MAPPIAIIGMSCRLPGASSPAELWELLRSGRDAVGTIPAGRFDMDAWAETSDVRVPSYSGGFLTDIAGFDAAAFGLSLHEALRLDPQHRLMLELAVEAVEDAGIPIDHLAGSRTAVYTGCLASDYGDRVRAAGMFDMHAAMGSGPWGMPSGRISRLLDLRGPSLGLEATCSTALLGVHAAGQDLRTGGADMAIVVAANLLTTADLYRGLAEGGILSPTGRCRFGDAAADGYVRSEGAVAVVLASQEQAEGDGRRIYAVIRGSGVTNNGRASETLIAPSVAGQADMLRRAYRDADVAPADVQYVEAHGAGTPRGDDIELAALSQVLGEGRAPGSPCYVGSVKSALGHCEAAAGLAGLARAALAVHHRWIPPTLHIRTPHARLADPSSPLTAVSEGRQWPDGGGLPLAGVSSFGLSATNVHVVLGGVEDVPPRLVPDAAGLHLLPLSDREPVGLRQLAAAYADALAAPDAPALGDVCHTASLRRTHGEQRAVVVAANRADMQGALRDLAEERPANGAATAVVGRATPPATTVFVFSGQGAHRVGAGSELLAHNNAFRTAVDACDAAVHAETGWSLRAALEAGGDVGPAEDRVQPLLWAVQVGLAAAWRSAGLEPDVTIGHSVGEIAAATVSGALSLEDAAAVVCRRGHVLRTRHRSGAMIAVALGAVEAEQLVARHAGRLALAAINGNQATVLAGDGDAVDHVAAELAAAGVHTAPLRVRYASHSPHMDELHAELVDALGSLDPREAPVSMVSTVTGERITGQRLDGRYWADNLRRPVLFSDAVHFVLERTHGRTLFVEMSPNPQLTADIDEISQDCGADVVALGAIGRGGPERQALAVQLAQAHVHGARLRWQSIQPEGRHVSVPTRPWQRRTLWVEPPPSAPSAPAPPPEAVATPGAELTWDSPADTHGCVVDQTIKVLEQVDGHGRLALAEVRWLAPSDGTRTRVVVCPDADGWTFDVRTATTVAPGIASWSSAVTGRAFRLPSKGPDGEVFRNAPVQLWCRTFLTEPGPGLQSVARRDGEAIGVLDERGGADPAAGGLSMSELLEIGARVLGACLAADEPVPRAHVIGVAELRPPGAPVARIHARLDGLSRDGRTVLGEIRMIGPADTVLGWARGVHVALATSPPAEHPPRPEVLPVPVPVPRDADPAEAGSAVRETGGPIFEHLAHLLAAPVAEIVPERPLAELGVDSLMIKRLHGWLNRRSTKPVALRELLRAATVGELVEWASQVEV